GRIPMFDERWALDKWSFRTSSARDECLNDDAGQGAKKVSAGKKHDMPRYKVRCYTARYSASEDDLLGEGGLKVLIRIMCQSRKSVFNQKGCNITSSARSEILIEKKTLVEIFQLR